jgi:HD-like signal output (HDOD) protein
VLPGPGPLADTERRALKALDQTLSLPALPEDLLPRAAALIPPLLALLRQTDLPVPELAERVSRDVVLTAEVLRVASSPYYRAQGAVASLAQAISLIGIQGLQAVFARVVLKPMYKAPPGPLSALAAPRLWDYPEALAGHTATLAGQAGQPAFDGYLAGLLHSSGWSIALRVLDRADFTPPQPPSAAFVDACAGRAHHFFGQAALRWNITPGFQSVGADARDHPLHDSRHPLVVALRQAQPLALADMSLPARA